MSVSPLPVRLSSGMNAGKLPLGYVLKARIKSILVSTVYGPPIPPAEREGGDDLSHWQGLIDIAKMNALVNFAYLKVSQGTNLPDDKFNTYRIQIGNLFPWGGYHFMTGEDGTAQASYAASLICSNPGLLPFVLDVELASVSASIVKAFCVEWFRRFGYYPIIYTSAYFWDKVIGVADKAWIVAHCLLFVAHWGTLSPILPDGWTNYTIHQYSADGNCLGATYGVKSRDIDLDYCRHTWLWQYMPQDWKLALTKWARTVVHLIPDPNPN